APAMATEPQSVQVTGSGTPHPRVQVQLVDQDCATGARRVRARAFELRGERVVEVAPGAG
ncbi:MAG TPA: hypothetical protein VF457_01430, partial [Burkholderiaceae bacterium]